MTLLCIDIKIHQFSGNEGITGIAFLAESHISIHTWPEFKYVAIDLFVCGISNPYNAIPILNKAFNTNCIQITEHKRGFIV